MLHIPDHRSMMSIFVVLKGYHHALMLHPEKNGVFTAEEISNAHYLMFSRMVDKIPSEEIDAVCKSLDGTILCGDSINGYKSLL